MTALCTFPSQPPSLLYDDPNPAWNPIQRIPERERFDCLCVEIEGHVRRLNLEPNSSRASASFKAAIRGIKSCAGDSQSTSAGLSQSCPSIASNPRSSGLGGSPSNFGKEKEGHGSTGGDPKGNDSPGSDPNGSAKDDKHKCPLLYKKGRKNVPDGCRETYETEEESM
jgi:hypothetical protein